MSERVIVAVDGGPASRSAIDWVIDRARTQPIDLQLVAVEDIGWLPVGAPTETYSAAYRGALEVAVKRVEAADVAISVATTMLRGDAAQELARVSGLADLLVVGSNRTSGLTGVMYGTLALRLAAHSRCPVAVIPADWRRERGMVVAASSADDTDLAALDYAAAEAGRANSLLLVVHAWSIPTPVSIGEFISDSAYDALKHDQSTALAGVAQRLRAKFPNLTIKTHLAVAPAAHAVVEAAGEAELIVIGSRGRGAIRGLILGSVSHDVVLHAGCPVVVIPAHGDQPAAE